MDPPYNTGRAQGITITDAAGRIRTRQMGSVPPPGPVPPNKSTGKIIAIALLVLVVLGYLVWYFLHPQMVPFR